MWLSKKIKELDEALVPLRKDSDHKRAEVEDKERTLRGKVDAVLNGNSFADGLNLIGRKLTDFRRDGR